MEASDLGLLAPISATPLPAVAYRKSGKPYDPREDVWNWVDGPFRLLIDYNELPDNFKQFKTALKSTLLVFVKGYSPSYAKNLFEAFVHFARANPGLPSSCAIITPREIGNYGATLEAHQKWRIGALNPLLQKWKHLNLFGIDQNCADYLRQRRKPGNKKGAAVRTRDPDLGPFTDCEFQAIFRMLTSAHEDRSVPLWVNVMARLLAACGARPSQIASLKITDFTPSKSSGQGNIQAKISIPQIKNGLKDARCEFLDFELSTRTATMLADHISNLIRNLNCTPNSPLFPVSLLRNDSEPDGLRTADDMFLGHPTGNSLASHFVRRLQNLAPISERTGFAPISLSPRRFRYTFGTRMAEEGASKAVIADRLGHTDLQNVDVYFEASPAIVDKIDGAMGEGLAPIAQAFHGRLIEGEHQAKYGNKAGSRIIDFRISSSPVGSCGKGSGCELSKPVACYTCHRFEPWLDGPHDESLHRLLNERQSFPDERIASVNDDAITALREIIDECKQARRQRREQGKK